MERERALSAVPDPDFIVITRMTPPSRRLLLLGPQPQYATLRRALERLGATAPVAVTTAGWQDAEGEDAELLRNLPSGSFNLRLFERSEQLFRDDPELIQMLRQRQDELRYLRDVYRKRLECLRQALVETMQYDARGFDLRPERQSAFEQIQHLDRQYFLRTCQVCDQYEQRLDMSRRPEVVRHRREIGEALQHAVALVISGGHAGIILNRLKIFDLLEHRPDLPVVAWSAGAMALSEEVVFFHDSPPQGPGNPEIMRAGVSEYVRILALPDARHRLKLDDPFRVQLFARRFAEFQCVIFDEQTLLDRIDGRWETEGVVQRLGADGQLEGFAA